MALLAMLMLLDGGAGRLTVARGAAWTVLAVLLFVVLVPPRVSAGDGWLATRGMLRERRVRTDRLAAVCLSDGVAQRLVLRDIAGGRVEIDPRVLIADPRLWRWVDAGIRTSLGRGTLLCGAPALRRLAERIDGETALAVFKVSGLGQGGDATLTPPQGGRRWVPDRSAACAAPLVRRALGSPVRPRLPRLRGVAGRRPR